MKFNFPFPWVKDPETQQNNDALKLYLDSLAASTGASANIACRLRLAADQTIPHGQFTAAAFTSEDYNTVGTAMHNASLTAKPLTGTVAKTAASLTIVGTGTAFLTEVVVGESITVPGGANETKVISTITDDTHLTVVSNFANTASGQAATVDASGRLYIPTTGVYALQFGWRMDGGASVDREFQIATTAPTTGMAVWELTTNPPIDGISSHFKFTAGQFIMARVRQTTGSNSTLKAVPYTCLAAAYLCAG